MQQSLVDKFPYTGKSYKIDPREVLIALRDQSPQQSGFSKTCLPNVVPFHYSNGNLTYL